MTVQIVRFKDGLDVVSQVYTHGIDSPHYGKMELVNPMLFQIRNQNLLLQNWLPLAVMKGDMVVVDVSEILCIMSPTDEFEEYYMNMVQEMKKEIMNVKKDSDHVDVLEAIAELNMNKNINIH